MKDAHEAASVWNMSSQQDFAGLHSVAKHCIYMVEAFDAMRLTVEGILGQHEQLVGSTLLGHREIYGSDGPVALLPPPPPPRLPYRGISNPRPAVQAPPSAPTPASATRALIMHKLSLTQATRLRLISLEKRTQNIINLVRVTPHTPWGELANEGLVFQSRSAAGQPRSPQ